MTTLFEIFMLLCAAVAAMAVMLTLQERRMVKLWKDCADRREGQINELLETCKSWEAAFAQLERANKSNEQTIQTLLAASRGAQ